MKTWRKMRQTRSKTRAQSRFAMGAQVGRDGFRPSGKLAIFLNDFTDSDNEAAAEVWAWAMETNPDIEAIYIAEPRHVSLGLAMTGKQIGACAALLKKHFSTLPDPPMTTILRGSLSPDALNKVEGLNDEEYNLLACAIRPTDNDPLDDSIRHARLLTLDYLTVMKERCKRSFGVFIDKDGLLDQQSPINPHMHHHEELVARTRAELENYQSIMRLPLDKRIEGLREWYQQAIARKMKQHTQDPIRFLDIELLRETIRRSDEVAFFGGASLSVLQRLLEVDDEIGQKIKVYQQGGTFDPKLNILGNPYNFALNPQAADFVFKNHDKLAKFVLIPTDTTKKIEYDLKNLRQLSSIVAYRSIAFHLRMDPLSLISPNESYDGQQGFDPEAFIKQRADDFAGYANQKVVMADLTAFLLSFTEAFGSFRSRVGAIDSRKSNNKEQMVLKKDDKSTIEVLLLDALDGVTVIGKTADFVEAAIPGYFSGT